MSHRANTHQQMHSATSRRCESRRFSAASRSLSLFLISEEKSQGEFISIMNSAWEQRQEEKRFRGKLLFESPICSPVFFFFFYFFSQVLRLKETSTRRPESPTPVILEEGRRGEEWRWKGWWMEIGKRWRVGENGAPGMRDGRLGRGDRAADWFGTSQRSRRGSKPPSILLATDYSSPLINSLVPWREDWGTREENQTKEKECLVGRFKEIQLGGWNKWTAVSWFKKKNAENLNSQLPYIFQMFISSIMLLGNHLSTRWKRERERKPNQLICVFRITAKWLKQC